MLHAREDILPINETYEHLYGYVPLTDKQIDPQ